MARYTKARQALRLLKEHLRNVPGLREEPMYGRGRSAEPGIVVDHVPDRSDTSMTEGEYAWFMRFGGKIIDCWNEAHLDLPVVPDVDALLHSDGMVRISLGWKLEGRATLLGSTPESRRVKREELKRMMAEWEARNVK